MVMEEVEDEQPKRMKADGPSWNGLAQSNPKMIAAECCMEVQLDMHGGAMVRTAAP